MGSRFTSPAADVRDMPEGLLSGHGPDARVSQQEKTYKLSERIYKGVIRMEPSLVRAHFPPQQQASHRVPRSPPTAIQVQKAPPYAGCHFVFSPNTRAAALTTPNRLQRFSIALSLTSKEAATDVTGSVQTASSNSSGSISNFRCHETRQGLEQVARLGTCDRQILMGAPHMAHGIVTGIIASLSYFTSRK